MLGEGSYGKVEAKNGCAVKTFSKLNHLIQEWVAGRYLSDAQYVVKMYEADLNNLTITMELYDESLREWMEKKTTDKEKLDVLRYIVRGLCELQSRNLVHADIKPGNILIKYNPFKVVLGDLGFVSLSPFAKVERTASAYRDIKISHSPAHDMYSLGIVILELFSGARPKDDYTYSDVHDLVSKKIKDGYIANVILRLTNKDHSVRPTAKGILAELYGETVNLQLPRFPYSFESKDDAVLKEWVKQITTKYKIKRGNKAYYITLCNSRKFTDKRLCSIAMLTIFSAIFGKRGFSYKVANKVCKHAYKTKEIKSTIRDLISDNKVITAIMLGN